MSTKTFRLSLSAPTIIYLLDVAKKDYAEATMEGNLDRMNDSIAAIAKLAIYQTKIDNMGLSTCYVSTSTKLTPEQKQAGILASVGGIGGTTSSTNAIPNDMLKEQYWEQCYKKELDTGAGSLSIAEINASNEHKYLHDLLSDKEVLALEAITL